MVIDTMVFAYALLNWRLSLAIALYCGNSYQHFSRAIAIVESQRNPWQAVKLVLRWVAS